MQAVLGAAFEEIVEARQFFGRGGDDDFAADFVFDAVLAAERDHLLEAANAEFGFGGAGLVIEAGVEDAAVVACLVFGQGAFFFEQGELDAGPRLLQAQGGCQTNNSTANHQSIVSHYFTRAALPSVWNQSTVRRKPSSRLVIRKSGTIFLSLVTLRHFERAPTYFEVSN